MSRFLSREAGRLAPYTPGEQPTDAQYIKLNTNESPFPPSPKVVKAISRAELLKLDLYPDPTCGTLHRAIAAYYGLKPENVLAANGSDEVLAFAFRAFCGEGKGVAYADITYGFYKSQAALFGLDATVIPLREDFTLNVDDYMDFPGTIVIANPNAPTGSGTVFFTGCTLQCCYCQNYKISQQGLGKPLTAERLAEIFMELQQKGAKNLNLVTATQWLPGGTQALDAARRNGLTLPVAYNTGGYETVETVKALAGYVDIWLADYKYASPALAKELSAAQDYPQVAHAAIRQMLLQTGAPVYDADGYLQKGVIVRHLALPGHSDDSLAVLQRLADLRQETGVSFVPSLMSQFTPFYRAAEHGLGRRITTYEYRKVVDRAIALGLTDGYMQEKSSAREEYTPPFDLEGV